MIDFFASFQNAPFLFFFFFFWQAKLFWLLTKLFGLLYMLKVLYSVMSGTQWRRGRERYTFCLERGSGGT